MALRAVCAAAAINVKTAQSIMTCDLVGRETFGSSFRDDAA
jgi:hypothetical protein